jgi:ferric-dicitrate binding protein FerR (iron transport regulator)
MQPGNTGFAWEEMLEASGSLRDQWQKQQGALYYVSDSEDPKAIIGPAHRIHFLKTAWFRYAAAVILILGTVVFLWLNKNNKPSTVAKTQSIPEENDVAPGRDGAVLTLANGTKVVLDSIGNGVIAQQNGAQVVMQNGQLAYDVTGKSSGAVVYNTMSTPKGRQFHVQLPDGTHAWLNAASSIRYPTVFAGNERKVYITGEIYFEVAKNRKMPFRVHVNDEVGIRVLGTHFNVKAYVDELSIKTTLLEGSVQVNAHNQIQTLQPGQQAQISADEKIKVMNDADMNQVMAWKNGLFNFNGYDIKLVMREIARWYDLEIVYEAEPKQREIGGKVQRSLTLNQVMAILKDLDIHYRLEGRTLIVTK